MAGHFPAVDVLASVSRVMTDVVTPDHNMLARRVREVLSAYKDAADLVEVGAYVSGTNPRVDAALRCINDVNAFLRQEPNERLALADTLTRLRKALDGKPIALAPKQEERRV
jgi:flagellum-specific ATP synthase